MNERRRQNILDHLLQKDVQARIRDLIQQGRNEATVTISQAAQIFDFSESRLRDWEDLGLLQPLRPSGIKGRRLYTPTELDKLAIIKELVDADFAPGDIPPDIYDLWLESEGVSGYQGFQRIPQTGAQVLLPDIVVDVDSTVEMNREKEKTTQYIDAFIDHVYYKELFYRYFVSHILHIVLEMICEETSETIAGVFLPLNEPPQSIEKMEQIEALGECLVGWLGRPSTTFYTFLWSRPDFEYKSDFRIYSLKRLAHQEQTDQGNKQAEHIYIVLQRTVSPPRLNQATEDIICRLISPLYDKVENWLACFGPGQRGIFDPLTDFFNTPNVSDIILNHLADMVVRLGQREHMSFFESADETLLNTWKFCCIFLPKDDSLPLPQQSLLVQAKSRDCPRHISEIISVPYDSTLVLSLRAFQSGNVAYRHLTSREDPAVARLMFTEDPTTAHAVKDSGVRSAIAVPVGGEDGAPAAVLYVAATVPDAFSWVDVSILRIIARIIEELLRTYRARLQASKKISDIVSNPFSVDTSFHDFRSERRFIEDVEDFLQDVRDSTERSEHDEFSPTIWDERVKSDSESFQKNVVSFIAVDIDGQSNLANTYGDRMTRNLSRLIGQRIQGQLRSVFRKRSDWQLYHIYADRFYIMLHNVPMEHARNEAEKLRTVIEGPQYVDALRSVTDRPTLRHEQMKTEATIRLAVTSYTYEKLREILKRYSQETALADVRSIMMRSLDEGLRIPDTSNSVVYWNTEEKMFMRWSPSGENA